MSFGDSCGPGERSLDGARWLARVGASPLEPLALVMGWSERVALRPRQATRRRGSRRARRDASRQRLADRR